MKIATGSNRRANLKARHRDHILDAARALIDERGGPHFTVDELAERADVARRTVFNHFASIDEILLTLCDGELEVLVADFLTRVSTSQVGDGSRSAVFDEIVESMASADLPLAIATVATLLGVTDADDARARALGDAVFTRAADHLLIEVTRRYPDAEPLATELMVFSLLSGVTVIARHWAMSTQARLDVESRAQWDELLTVVTDNVRSGYSPRS